MPPVYGRICSVSDGHFILDEGTQKHGKQVQQYQSPDQFVGGVLPVGEEKKMDSVEEERQDRDDIERGEDKAQEVIEKDTELSHLADGKKDQYRQQDTDDQPAQT